MNKAEYLLKKGITKPNLGIMYVIHSTREFVVMHEIVINAVEKGPTRTYYNSDGIKEREDIPSKRYKFSEPPFKLDIEEGEDVGRVDGYGTGCGDLWVWSYFGSLDQNVALKYLNAERERVEEKYFFQNVEN